MAKNNRVELRLSDEDYQLLRDRADYFGASATRAVESLLQTAVPVRITGVYPVGVKDRRRLNVTFSNGMTVHGFLWSRGGQLLGPSVTREGRQVRIVNGTRAFWWYLRRFCAAELGVHGEPGDRDAKRRIELVEAL